MKALPPIYKIDSKGKVRVWWVEISDDLTSLRNIAGLQDGEKVISEWKVMKVKNVGKANETTLEQQAEKEAAALYDKKLAQGGYTRDLADATDSLYIKPMLAEPYKDSLPLIANVPIYSQPKFDGMRCIATRDGLFTRKGKEWKSVPHVALALYDLFEAYPDLILDGELYNHALHDDFNKISSILRKQKPEKEHLAESSKVVQYHVYDIVDESLTFSQRFSKLVDLFRAFNPESSVLVETVTCYNEADVDAAYGGYIADNYEGQILRYDREYVRDGRHKTLMIKRKEFFEQEYKLKDIVEGEGNWAGAAAKVVFELENGDTSDAGLRMSKADAVVLLREKDQHIGGDVTIRFPNKTPDNKPRFAKAIDFHRGNRVD